MTRRWKSNKKGTSFWYSNRKHPLQVMGRKSCVVTLLVSVVGFLTLPQNPLSGLLLSSLKFARSLVVGVPTSGPQATLAIETLNALNHNELQPIRVSSSPLAISSPSTPANVKLSSQDLAARGNKQHVYSDETNSGLARSQSYGFYDEPDGRWKMRQRIHREHVQEEERLRGRWVGKSGSKSDVKYWMSRRYNPSFSCDHERRVGRNGDYGKWICDPHKIREQTKDCLVYSIGSNANYVWEKYVHETISEACEIHTIDIKPWQEYPGAKPPPNYVNYHVFKVGTAADGGTPVSDIVRALGHQGRTIDLFKIDCEGCEWSTYTSWFSGNVFLRQILLELHSSGPAGSNGTDGEVFFAFLANLGYVIFHKELNTEGCCGTCTEFAFLKLDPRFAVDVSVEVQRELNRDQAAVFDSMSQDESFGFFNEEEHLWSLRKKVHLAQMREESRLVGSFTFRMTREGERLPMPANVFHFYRFQPTYSCEFAQEVGARTESSRSKWICNPHVLMQQVDSGGSCLIYSLVSVVDLIWERAFQERFSRKCEIHVILAGSKGQSERSLGIEVHTFDVLKVPLVKIMEALGHRGRRIDVLNVACQGCEWVLSSWLNKEVFARQILMSWNMVDADATRFNDVESGFSHLFQQGYVIYHKEPAPEASCGSIVDLGLLKLSPKFSCPEDQKLRVC